MKNIDSITLLIINATPNFPEYFIHPLQKMLQEKGINMDYIDLDSHSDDFYVDFIIQSLPQKKGVFVYIEIESNQKKLPNNCLKILSQIHKYKEKVHILYSNQNIVLQAYTKHLPTCTEVQLPAQVAYIQEKVKEMMY